MKKLLAILPALCLLICLASCAIPRRLPAETEALTEASPEPTEPAFSMLYYEVDLGRAVYIDGLAVTKETYGQVMSKGFEEGIETYVMKERLCSPTELRYGCFEIELDEVLDETRSYTVWVQLRSASMYVFSNVFLRSGDKLMITSPNERMYLVVDHGDADTRRYCSKLVWIE